MKVVHGRRLDSSNSFMNAVLPSNSTFFAFDGANSDLARQLYLRAKVAGDAATPFSNFSIPSAVEYRLKQLRLDWSRLLGIAQRALLWDSGFAVSPTNEAVQIWPLHDVSLVELRYVGCQEHACIQPDSTPSYTSQLCTGDQILKAARCVVQDFSDTSDAHTSIWVTRGKSDAIPTPRVRKHAWTSHFDNNSYGVFAVHMIDQIYEPAWNECARADQNGGFGSLVLPCRTTANISLEIKTGMQQVQGSPWVSRWLAEDFGTTSGATNDSKLVSPAAVAAGICVLVGVVGLALFVNKKQYKKNDREAVVPTPKVHNGSSNAGPNNDTTSPEQLTDVPTEDTDTERVIESCPRVNTPARQMESECASDSNVVVETLFNSVSLIGRRIPYDSLTFERSLSTRGAREVWLGTYRGQQVVIKKLLETDSPTSNDPDQFVKEIELSASLTHPNIVSVFGVAWNNSNSLVMVVEYYPTGNLQAYLAKNTASLLAKDVLRIAIGIGLAVEYLHSRSPPLLHRGIRSRNVLLTKTLKAKLVGFGLSRSPQEHLEAGATKTEVVEGKRYSEQADIYSFGAVLSALDRGMAINEAPTTGEKNRFQIWANAMSRILRPSFSDECRQRIRQISAACCQIDPVQRPTAPQVVKMLKGIV
ncbi:hypothetical protein PHYSODRAFT_519978 [Phytophthora sojae]|uniref:Protein kinase domain-containing protein n=1 Tax=Phytophthora sojae (strain P6497) TaxID=1094619 RepID=G4ZZT9_PHYSP|nr:hypothetical protein PHYSODRAFT_519978 [Phytophthora sojae]EGZ11236.1 hypothetical protein PHYSODRAFT_519978 [Phytophthora sojae]|eukprot:XP_009533981.1 hypothetical protein PHYSODRAFT_519978 [Phytophthora sojae]